MFKSQSDNKERGRHFHGLLFDIKIQNETHSVHTFFGEWIKHVNLI